MNTTNDNTPPADIDDTQLVERLQAATEALERIAEDHSLLAKLPTEARDRLQRAVAGVYHPDPMARRQRMKAAERARNAEAIAKDDAVLDNTGIRELRRKPVFTTTNYFPPTGFEADDIKPGEEGARTTQRQTVELQHCYVCKQKYNAIHHFYDQMCPTCAEFNFHKRTELADLQWPCCVADRRAGQDRLPDRPETAALRRAPDRHHALSARLGTALCGRTRLRTMEGSAGDLRPGPAAYAER